jgi:hypothetical protein
MRFRISTLIFLLLAFLALVPAAFGQFETGSIIGTVKDASGAVIADATVTVTNTATNVVTRRQTTSAGDYEVPGLRVGTYNVQISKEGFAPALASGIGLDISARQRVDLTLSVGTATVSVDVSSAASLVETDNSQRGQIITNYQTSSLPLVSRNYTDLLALSTGVHQAPSTLSTTATTGLIREGAYNVDGQRSIFNNFLLDGMDNNAYGESNQGFSNQIFNPPPDSIAQFQVVTNNQSAEYGRASGATFNVAYRSGTNQYHGLAYEFIRNRALNAIGYFRAANPIKPQFNRNQFGGNFAGPILHDKLFFFVDYEAFRQLRSQPTTVTLPTANQRAGIFSKTVYDPYTGVAYAAGTPVAQAGANISATAVRVLKLLPANTNSNATSNYTTLQRSQNFSDKGSIRLDYQLDPKDSFFVRVSDLKQNATDFPLFPLPIDGNTNGKQRILDQQVAVGWTRILGANQLLDARFGLSRTKAGKFSLSIGDNSFNFPGLPSDPSVAGGLPSTTINGFAALGRQATNPQFQNPALMNPKINYSWIVGRHSLKMGYEYQHIWMAVQDTNPLYGGWSFAGAFSRNYDATKTTKETATPDNYVADYLFGAPSAYSISSFFVAHLRNQSHYAYLQDDWKVTPKLTFNLGLRYEYGSPYWEQKNLQTNFNPAIAATAGTGAMIQATDGNRTLVDSDKNDFAPRLGFAYAPDDKTSFRGGYGISYVHYSRAGSGDILAINAPQALFITQAEAPDRANPSGAAGFRTMDQGFPGSLPFNPLTDNITYIDSKRFRDSYVHSYYLSAQRQLAHNTLLDVAYVGNHGLKLAQFANSNQKQLINGALVRPIPNYGDVTIALHSAYSHYDSLQVRYEQRMVAGLTLLNSFTYSHTLDNAGASLEANTPSPQDYYNLAADYGTSEYDQPLINTTSLVYEVPFGRGKKFMDTTGVLNQVVGGWQISAVNQAQSGLPFNITYSPTSANIVSNIAASYRGSNLYRPNRVGTGPLTSLTKAPGTNGTTSLQYINLSALAFPASGTSSAPLSPFGNLSRDAGRTPNINYLNLAINKRFDLPFREAKIEFRSELYNILNHTNFAAPNGISGGVAAAANSTPTGGGVISSTLDPRIVQFGLKVSF